MIEEELRAQFPGDIDALSWLFNCLRLSFSPFVKKGHAGPHGVEEIGAGCVPPYLDSNLYDEARGISEEDMPCVDDLLGKKECLLGLQQV